MAYMNQEMKAKLAPSIKAVLKKYGMKGTISTSHHSLSVNIKSGKLPLCDNYYETCAPEYSRRYSQHSPIERKDCEYIQVNEYHYQDHFTGECQEFIGEMIAAMNDGNHDNSDAQVDYFDVGWYTHLNVGKWNKPYEVTK